MISKVPARKYFVLLLIVLLAGNCFLYGQSASLNESSATTRDYDEILAPPNFSHFGGFYEKGFSLHLSHPDPEVILIYTLDGSEPRIENLEGEVYHYKNAYVENPGEADGRLIPHTMLSRKYNNAIKISKPNPEPGPLSLIPTTWHNKPGYLPQGFTPRAVVVRARAVSPHALSSQVVTHTYFIGTETPNSDAMVVMSITTDSNFLFDYHEGIYVAGRDFDEWRTLNPTKTPEWHVPANYHRRGAEWEYPAHFELFAADGNRVYSNDMGFRLHGGASRRLPAKSLRLYARDSYGNSSFDYPFFKDEGYSSFNRLLLRNSGQDWEHTLFRDASIQRILGKLNFQTQAYRPGILFINGEYWGIHNIRERYDKHYLERVYGINPDEIDYISHYYEAGEGDKEHFDETINFFRNHDLKQEEHYAFAQTLIDIENFTDYHIAQIFIANNDWPISNTDIWRVRTDFDPGAAYGHDGRWRWLLFDTDVALGYWAGVDFNSIIRATDPDFGNGTLLLRKLLRNPEYKKKFISRFADLLNSHFLPERTTAILDEMQRQIAPEIPTHSQRWSTPADKETWRKEVRDIEDFLKKRVSHQRDHILDFFELEANIEVHLDVSHPLHGHVVINTLDLVEATPGIKENPYPWKGVYFKHIPVEVRPVPAPGYRFSHWEGNYEGSDSLLVLDASQNIRLKAHFNTHDEPVLINYWMFDESLPNNTPLEEIPASYSLQDGAFLSFTSCLPGYPFSPGHFHWRKASLERRNQPSSLNYRPQGNHDLPYWEEKMRAIQVRQPFAYGAQESELILHLPVRGIKDPVFQFVARDEGAAHGLYVDFSFSDADEWQESYYLALSAYYQLYTFDFNEITEASSTECLKVRIRFASYTPTTFGEGRVVFNNFSLDGTVCMAYQLKAFTHSHGTIEPEGLFNAWACGTEVFQLTPSHNHVIKDLLLDGNSVIDKVRIEEDYTGEYILDTPHADHRLQAVFAYDPLLLDEESTYVIYPNPVSGNLYVSCQHSIYRVELYDMAGRRVYQQELTQENYMMDMRILDSGFYIIRLYTEQEIITQKIQHLKD